MKNFHVITGTPRSGSTLLCNILNQNPDFSAGTTSPLPEILGVLVNKFSTSIEIQAALIQDRQGTEKKLNDMLLSVIECWHQDSDKVVFDKSRGWTFNALLLDSLFDNVKIIATVRDLRSMFGSIEKQHRRTPMFDLASSANEKTVLNRADVMMAPDGLVGQCVVGLEDVMARARDKVFVLNYESFSIDPRTKMMELYNFLEIPYFDHDFDNVANVADEVDGLHLNKFPHEGSGKVTPTSRDEWTKFLTPELGGMIQQRYPGYNSLFGYQ